MAYRFLRLSLMVAACLGIGSLVLAQGTPSVPKADEGESVITNAGVKQLIAAGLDAEVVIAKIGHSYVDFDVSTEGLVDLKDAGVPSSVVAVMIGRPKGSPPADPSAPTAKPQYLAKTVGSLAAVRRVYIKAPTEVLRTYCEQEMEDAKGPATVPETGDPDSVLVIGVDCGDQTLSMWSGANYCTCEGSMTLESGGKRLWTTSDRERAATGPKAAKYMIERMVKEFARAWKKAQSKG